MAVNFAIGAVNLVGNLVDSLLGGGAAQHKAFAPGQQKDQSQEQTPNVAPPATPPEWQLPALGLMANARVEPADEQAIARAQIDRRAAAVAATFRSHGEVDAARELRARTRDLPPGLAAEVVVAAQVTVEAVAARIVGTELRLRAEPRGTERAERLDATAAQRQIEPSSTDMVLAARREQAAADLAGAIAHAAHDSRGLTVTRDLAAVLVEGAMARGSESRLASFSLGIPFGTGLVLPFAFVDELARRNATRGQHQLMLAIAQGLGRLNDRASTTVNGLVALTQPFAPPADSDPAAWDPGGALGLLREHARANPGFLGEFAEGLRRLDGIGADVCRTLGELAARSPLAPELEAARADLLANPATALAIAESAAARDLLLQRGESGETAAPERRDTLMQVCIGLGFSQTRSALLADTICAWRSAVMIDARWAEATRAGALQEAGHLFESLLRFLRPAPPNRFRAIGLAEIDDDGTEGAVRRDEETEDDWPSGLALLRELECAK